MSVKQNLFVQSLFTNVDDVEYATFKIIVRQMSSYLFVISFQLMFYKTLRYRLPEPHAFSIAHLISKVCTISFERLEASP